MLASHGRHTPTAELNCLPAQKWPPSARPKQRRFHEESPADVTTNKRPLGVPVVETHPHLDSVTQHTCSWGAALDIWGTRSWALRWVWCG